MKGILLAVIIEKISTLKDRSCNIILNTQELNPSKAGELFTLLNMVATVYISPSEITTRELTQVDAIEPDLPGKSPSQRMRNVLYLNWKKDGESYKEFDTYYRAKIESYIEALKQNLD